MVLALIILATFLISLIAFVGMITLFMKEKLLGKILLVLVSLSAGALMGGAFLHLIPEAIEHVGNSMYIFLYVLLGFSMFFVLEQFIYWHHCHRVPSKHRKKPVSYLILFSDSIHNFIDGLVIAGSFLINIPLGIVTTLAIALHEVPQEIGDFGVLVYGGFERKKALVLNFIAALTVVIGGIVGYCMSDFLGEAVIFLLPFAAGNFIYIASSDLVPLIKNENLKKGLLHFIIFILGILLMLLIKFI